MLVSEFEFRGGIALHFWILFIWSVYSDWRCVGLFGCMFTSEEGVGIVTKEGLYMGSFRLHRHAFMG
jgi:hypothetical protein